MYALGIHLGSLTTQAVYVDQFGSSGLLTDLEESRVYPIPSWVALDDLGSLVGHAALRLQQSETPPTLIRFAREALLLKGVVPIKAAGQPRTVDEIGALLLSKILRELPTQRRENLCVTLTVPDGISADRKQQLQNVWSSVAGLRHLALREDSFAAFDAANARTVPSGDTLLSLVFDEDALKLTLLRRQPREVVVAAHTVVDAISLLTIRNALVDAIREDAGLLANDHPRQNGTDPTELERFWYNHGEAFVDHCAAPAQTPFARDVMIHYGNRYLTPIFTPAALDGYLEKLRQLLESSLIEFARHHVGASIDYALCTGKLGMLLDASGFLQKTLGLRPDGITCQPDTALAHGAALYSARIGSGT